MKPLFNLFQLKIPIFIFLNFLVLFFLGIQLLEKEIHIPGMIIALIVVVEIDS